MKKTFLLIGCLISLSLAAENPAIQAHVCQVDNFLAGCTVFPRAEGDQTGVPVDIGGTTYDLYLSWGTPAEFAYTDSMATGGTYIFNCQVLTEAGTYTETLTKADGCDSTVTLTLTEYVPCSPVEFAYTDSMATGGTYIFNCQVLTAPGTYSETLTKADGCDSIVTLTLTEYVPCSPVEFAYTDSIAVGGTYIFNCQVLTEAGTYTETLTKADGCDSIVTLTLTEYVPCSPVEFSYTDSIAKGGTYIFNCQVLTAPGTYTETLTKADGCDSTVTLTLTEYVPCSPVEFAYTDSIAVGGTYIFNCQVLTAPGTYTETLTKADGCDSTVTLTLTEYVPCSPVEFAYTDSMATGGTYIFNCQVLTAPGTYTETLTKADGCDSIVTLTLTEYSPVIINDTLRDTIPVTICFGEPFTDRLDVTYYPTQDTVVLDTIMISRDTTLTLIHTIDSIYRYEITVQQPKDSLTTATICAGESFSWFGNDYSVADTYFDTLHYTTGCDSIRGKLILTVQQPKDSLTTATICAGESFSWFGNDYSVADTYFDTLHYTTGCDSIRGKLILTVQSRYLDSLPALVKDDSWLLMIHRRSIVEDYGINFNSDQVHWYKVVGEVDEYPYGEDNDTKVGTGDYYTVASKMSGQYYALIDVDVTWIRPCALYARTVILDCDNPQPVGPVLSPTYVTPGGLMKLTNLAQGETQLNVFTPAGQLIRTEKVLNETEHELRAEGVCGFYLLQVNNDGQKYVFKYVVTQ